MNDRLRQSRRDFKRNSRRAFSLVELIMVLAIMVTLAGITIPRYGRSLSRYRADAAARRVAADLRQAAQRARAGSGACSIAFSTTAGTYTMTYPTVGGVAGRTVTVNLVLPPYSASITSVNFNNGVTASFDGYGTPMSGGTVRIASGSETRTITLTAATNAVAVSTP